MSHVTRLLTIALMLAWTISQTGLCGSTVEAAASDVHRAARKFRLIKVDTREFGSSTASNLNSSGTVLHKAYHRGSLDTAHPAELLLKSESTSLPAN